MGHIAVLGGGGTGCYIAANLTMLGHCVTLYEEKSYWSENIDDIIQRGGVEMTGLGPNGFAKINKITDDLQGALEGADLVIVAMVAWRHDDLAQKLKPLVTDDTVIILSAGNFGSIRIKLALDPQCKAVVGEMLGNMFSCRMLAGGTSVAGGVYKPKLVAAFPAQDTPKLMERFGKYFECAQAKNVFETALNAPNVVIHLPGSILNTCSVDKDPEFALYRNGLSKSVINCQKAVEAEKAKVMETMGYKMVVHTDLMDNLVQYDKFPELDYFRDLKGPSSMEHRYVVEDATVGVALLIQMGERLGIPTPTASAFVQIAGAMNGADYISERLELSALGIHGTTPDAINQYLHTGKS